MRIMTEYFYGLSQRTGRAPVIKKLGALRLGMEQTPLCFKGRPVMAESTAPDGECGFQHIRVRDISTGKRSAPFGIEYYFASAFATDEMMYVFATSRRDDKPLTMYTTEDASQWHDPRGGHCVRMFSSADLENWTERDVICCPDRRLWNTSVCRGDGKYIMAIEVSPEEGFDVPQIGAPFTTFFAESADLENWTMLPDDFSYTPSRYNACPAIRFSRGYYYMICLEALPCARYAPYIYRTKNLCDWEVGFHNPMMMWGDDDRVPAPGASFTPEELSLLETGLNINCSDLDLFERDGKTHIYYANGDQMSYSFLCEAVCDLGLEDFLEAFFK